jgi:hypothetical protein
MERGHAIKIIKRKRGTKKNPHVFDSLFFSSKNLSAPTVKKRFFLCSLAQIHHHATHHRVEFVFRTLFNKYFLAWEKAQACEKAAVA